MNRPPIFSHFDRSSHIDRIVIILLGFALVVFFSFVLNHFYGYWFSIILVATGVIAILVAPIAGIAITLFLLYFPIFPTIGIGPVEISISTVPLGVLALVAIGHILTDPGSYSLAKWQTAMLVLLGLAFGITSILSTSYYETLPIVPNLILYIITLFALMVLVNTYEKLAILAKVIMILAFTSYLISVLNPFFNIPALHGLGFNGLIFRSHPAFAICLVAIFALLPLFSHLWRNFAWLCLIVLFVAGVVMETRSAWLAQFVMLALAFICMPKRGILILMSVIIFIAVAISLLSNTFQPNLDQTKETIAAIVSGQTNPRTMGDDDYFRYVSNQAAIQMYSEHPLTGMGPNLYAKLTPLYIQESHFVYGNSFNSWLKILAEMGLIGFGAVALAFVTPLLVSWKTVHKREIQPFGGLAFAFVLGVIGLAVHLYFIDLMYSFVWFHIGLALAAARLAQDSIKST